MSTYDQSVPPEEWPDPRSDDPPDPEVRRLQDQIDDVAKDAEDTGAVDERVEDLDLPEDVDEPARGAD